MPKTITIDLSERELFCLYAHFKKNVATQSSREQDEYDDLWQSLHFDDIREAAKAMGPEASELDFSDATSRAVELTKEEIGYFLKFCGRPMMGELSQLIRPIRKKIEAARDSAGLKAVLAEG